MSLTNKKPISQKIKFSFLGLAAVFALSIGITGGLMVETESDVSAAAISDVSSDSGSDHFAATKKKTTKKKVKCKKGYTKKNNKCVKKKKKVLCKYGKYTSGKSKGKCKPKPAAKKPAAKKPASSTKAKASDVGSGAGRAGTNPSAGIGAKSVSPSNADGIGAGAGSAGGSGPKNFQ